MNDISYINNLSDKAILLQIGRFIKQKRIDQQITQQELADRAAISRSTLSLIERGENIALLTLIKILRILDALYVFDDFKDKSRVSPILLAKEEHKRPRRARSSKGKNKEPDLGW